MSVSSSLSLPASPGVDAVVAVGSGADMAAALATVLDLAGLEAALDAARGKTPRERASVAVRPVLPPGTARGDPPLSYADPALVKSLVERIRPAGWAAVDVLVPGPGGVQTATRVGYSDTVIDLSADTVEIDYRGVVGPHVAARRWRDADVRILVGKYQADRQLLYDGAMVSALGTVPNPEALAGRTAAAYDLAQCARTVWEALPVAFAVIDAWWSADAQRLPRATERVLASSDLLALDWVAGELIDVEPALNAVVQEALYRRGRIRIDRRGNLTPLDDWRGVSALRAVLADIGAGHQWGRLLGAREVPWTAR
jgi:uncharacterized protein (DUF362 family)